MYPFLRMFKELLVYRTAPKLGLFEVHVSHHLCWPWDLDFWMELNNGRTLTLFDLGRVPLGRRTGLDRVLIAKGWGLAVAGSSIRYRRRVTVFNRLEMRTRCVGWDARFVYMEQSMWRSGECTSHVLIRSAITSRQGMVAPAEMARALGADPQSPPLPDWVTAWIAADALRLWPPQM